MIRKIIHIDEDACIGCGICAEACHEGAIGMVDGKARLLREDYCDGLGDCLPACPTGAITFEEREAPAYDHAAVLAAQAGAGQGQAGTQQTQDGTQQAGTQPTHAGTQQTQAKTQQPQTGTQQTQTGTQQPQTGTQQPQTGTQQPQTSQAHNSAPLPCGCPGSQSKQIDRPAESAAAPHQTGIQSRLTQWPVQIKLAPVNAPYFDDCHLLIAADCSAYAYGDFHREFMDGRVTLIGCPKLDAVDYAEKLTEIFARNAIRSATVVRMEVPCCGGIEYAARTAHENSGKAFPLNIVTLSTDGRILARA